MKVILRDWDLAATATLHSTSGSFIQYLQLFYRYVPSIWPKLNALMSSTGIVI